MRRAALVVTAAALAVAAAAAPAHAGKRSRRTAQALSGVGAGASSAIVLGAFLKLDGTVNMPLFWTGTATSIITPSLGEWYAGEWLTYGMAIRTGTALLAAWAIETKNDPMTCGDDSHRTCHSLSAEGVEIVGVAAIFYIGGVALDVLDAGDAADRYNEKHGYALTPIIIRGAPGSAWRDAYGLSLAGTW